MLNRTILFSVLAALLFSSSCEGFLGKKTDTEFLDVPVYDDKQVAYVPILPMLEGFANPVDVITGYDELIYVADAGTEQIISFDQSGNELGRFNVPGLQAIAQDRQLDILAIGITDTLIDSTRHELTTIYRLDLKQGIYGLNNAQITNKIIHPFYYKVTFNKGKDPLPRFTSIGIRANNKFYVSRTGPNNSPTQFGGPDDAVLLFDDEDKYETPISIQTSSGFFLDYFKTPTGLTSIAQPPQSAVVNESGDFIFTSLSGATALQVQYIEVQENEFGISYTVKDLPPGDTSKADRFLYEPFRFGAPVDVTYTGDGSNFIFVIDSEKDSVFQFTNTGLEGVPPPAGSIETKNISVSFGGTGSGLTQFNNPTAVAYLDKILYVADAGNGRVMRFKLTTDID